MTPTQQLHLDTLTDERNRRRYRDYCERLAAIPTLSQIVKEPEELYHENLHS